MNHFLAMAFIIPLATAVLSILFRKSKYRDYFSISGSIVYLINTALLTKIVLTEGSIVYQAGGWVAPFGITFVADPLSVLMISMVSAVSIAGNLYSWSYIDKTGKQSGYYAYFHFMIAGMTGAFLTGDLFNLFVMFEIVLMSSYAMVAYRGTKESLFTSLKYVILNLIGSSLMLVAIGGLYSVTGTLNMAHMAQILSTGTVNMTPVLGLSSILFCVFAIKSGLVPFHFWAPTVYSNSPPPATAMMAGITKKVGIYAVIRLYLTVFSGATIPGQGLLGGKPLTTPIFYLVAIMATVTIILGGTSALNRDKLDKMLSYSSIGQIGFIFIPIAITMVTGSKTALSASLVYIISHSIAKSSLFMISGTIEKATGTTKITQLGGLSEKSLPISTAYFISTFSLIGIPPLLGFFGKFTVFQASINYGNIGLILVLIFGAVTSLLYFGNSWLEIFFGKPVETDFSKITAKEMTAILFLTVLVIALGLGFEPLYQFIEKAAETALNRERYIDLVLGGTR
jgi:multicomponent Na+:H+ antiporter subunit D